MTYEYKCSIDSEHKYLESRGINDPQKQQICVVDGCEGRLLRVFSAPPITFKGTGFSSKNG